MDHVILAPDSVKDEAINDVFTAIDTNHNGRIDASELRIALKYLKLPASHALVDETIKNADADGDGSLSFEEFKVFVKENNRLLREQFNALDSDKNGTISLDELCTGLRKLGVAASDAEITRIFHRMDRDHSGGISFADFYRTLWLVPSSRTKDMFLYWQRATITGGTDLPSLPDDVQTGQPNIALRTLLAGGAAGCVSRTATAPLDRIKILLQLQSAQGGGLRSAFDSIMKEGSVKAFFRGNGTNCIKIAPEAASRFLAYEKLKGLFNSDPSQLTAQERFAAGSLAGVLSQSLVYPLEVVKTRLAASSEYKGVMDVLGKTVRQEGFKALYRGLAVSLAGIIPYAGTDLMVYESIKNMFMQQRPGEDPTVPMLLVAGTTSSVTGQLVSYPFAMIRTRLQAQPRRYSGALDACKRIVQEDGVRALYRGIIPNFMKVIPAVCMSYVVYENSKKYLQQHGL